MKIAILLSSDGNIAKVNSTSDEGAQRQSYLDGSIVVNANTSFRVEDKDNWTVRESDNVLVHKDTNQTPEEEKNAVITQLTLQNLQQANEINELKKISTSQTLQVLQDAKDKEEQQKVITNQTVQILELQKSV